MQLTRWSPFMDPFNFEKEFEKFFKEMRPANLSGDMQAPSLNMYEKKGQLVVEASVPGVDADNVNVEIDENNVLTIKGSSKKKTEVDDKNYYRKEIRSGSFFRSVQLPTHVKGEQAVAEYEDGMLVISVPIDSPKKAKAIKVTKKKKLGPGEKKK